MKETWGRKWSLLENWSKEKRKLFWILVPTVPTIVFFLCIGIAYALGCLSQQVLLLILLGILFFLGFTGLAIRIGGTYDASKLTKKGYRKQKRAAIAIIIALILMLVWLIPISIFTTQTDYSDVDPLLIDAGVIEDKSHLLYLSAWQVVLFLSIITFLQASIIYVILGFLDKI